MDHRGVGKCTQLECKTPESAGSGSSNKSGLQPAQVPSCAKELDEKFGDLAAFSTTSAAMDLVSFIADHGSDYTTVIYGMNYGSLLLERIMHINPPEVTGYVFDFGETADTLLDLCAEDRECSARYKKKGLEASLRYLVAKLDKTPLSKCSKLVNSLQIGDESDPPSFALRILLAMFLQDVSTRTLIAPISYRLLRCAKKDVNVLAYYVKTFNVSMNQTDEPASIEARQLPRQRQRHHLLARRILVQIPDQASVLVISSELESRPPSMYAKSLRGPFGGEKKELVTFKYFVQNNYVVGDVTGAECGAKMIASYVQNDGNLEKLDKACVEEEVAMNWTTPESFYNFYLGADDVYDGGFDATVIPQAA